MNIDNYIEGKNDKILFEANSNIDSAESIHKKTIMQQGNTYQIDI